MADWVNWQSRSMIVQTTIANYRQRQRQIELARQSARFFGQLESPEEAAERADWEALGLEVLSRDE
jgi:hypothetical protein